MLQPVKHTRGLPLVCNYIFPTGELKTGHSNPDAALQVLNRGKNHSPPPAGYAVVSTAQYEAGPLPWKDRHIGDLDSAGRGPFFSVEPPSI